MTLEEKQVKRDLNRGLKRFLIWATNFDPFSSMAHALNPCATTNSHTQKTLFIKKRLRGTEKTDEAGEGGPVIEKRLRMGPLSQHRVHDILRRMTSGGH